VIYTSSALYRATMRLLYGRHFGARYRVIADLIPARASVLDVCCGPPDLLAHLQKRGVTYTGLDLNRRFIRQLIQAGGTGCVWDVRQPTPLPRAEYVVMQGSLYHFLPDARPIVERMLAAARRQVIIAEPIRNLTSIPALRWLSSRLTDPGSGAQARRFTEATLDALLADYRPLSLLIPGGREKVYVLTPNDGAA
jgi:SAM-dependent methyltransferase